MDWATAAGKLGISEEQLRQAFEDSGQGPPDLAKAAANLGIAEEVLREALGIPSGMPGPGGMPTGTRPPPTPGS